MACSQQSIGKSAGLPRILTNIREPRVSVAWQQQTEFRPEIIGYDGRDRKLHRSPEHILQDIIAAIRLLLVSRRYDIVVLATGRVSSMFTMVSAVLPGKRVPILIVPCQWFTPRNPFIFLAKRIQFRLMAQAVSKFVVWASHEIRDYAAAFSIPEHKFLHVPHHHTLEGYEFEVTYGDYIFSGGDGNRDYTTLIKAVRGLGVRAVVATRLHNWHCNLPVPPEITAFPTDHSDFRKWMAGSKMVVVPMKKTVLHVGGEQTYLNAMAMGKPVIVADDLGAIDYIENRVNGLIVPSGDRVALRKAIKALLEDPGLAARLGSNAKKAYNVYSTTKCMERILQIAAEIVRQAHRC
jgi:glycosyltransferase involved in cell wall biosynthesis